MANPPDLGTVALHLQIPVYEYHQYQGASNHCGPTSLAIAANALLGEARFDGERVAQELNDWRRRFPKLFFPRIRDWATFPWGIVQYLRLQNFHARWHPFGTPERLRRNLHAGQMTIVMIGEPYLWKGVHYTGWAHAKVLFGYSPERGFLFVDPASNRSAFAYGSFEGHGLTWQPEDAFARQWRLLLGIFVEIGETARSPS